MSLHKVNLNLLPVLRELLRHRSVNGAALALGRSPSAISQGLGQLRAIFDDPILVRTGARMVLTLRGEQLIELVEDAHVQIERVLKIDAFNPAHAERIFVIACTDYDVFAHSTVMLEAVAQAAPRIGLRFVDLGAELQMQITNRDVDFVLLPEVLIGELASDRMPFHIIAASKTVVMMQSDHPLASFDRIDEAMLAEYEHIAFYPAWEGLGRRSLVPDSFHNFNIRMHVSNMISIPTLIAGTTRLMLGPELVAQKIGGPLGLVHRELAFPIKPVRTALSWGAIQDADPAHRWFRETVLTAYRARDVADRSAFER